METKKSRLLFSECIGEHTILMTPRGRCRFLLWLPSRRAVAFIAKDNTVYELHGADFKRVLAAEHKRMKDAGHDIAPIPAYVLAERTKGQEWDDFAALSKHLIETYNQAMGGVEWP